MKSAEFCYVGLESELRLVGYSGSDCLWCFTINLGKLIMRCLILDLKGYLLRAGRDILFKILLAFGSC